MAEEPIRSKDNALLKLARAVAAGNEPGWLLLEGERLIDDARRAAHALESVLVAHDRPELAARFAAEGLAPKLVRAELLDALSRLRTAPGCLALVRAPAGLPLERLPRGASALVLVVAGVADPGNLGALARSAEAAGADALLVAQGGCSPWNEKALRGSMGSLLRLPVGLAPLAEIASALRAAGYRGVRAATRGGRDYAAFNWSGRVALWLSAETGEASLEGLPQESVSIPMRGPAESLNVAAAAAVLLFEAARRRVAPR